MKSILVLIFACVCRSFSQDTAGTSQILATKFGSLKFVDIGTQGDESQLFFNETRINNPFRNGNAVFLGSFSKNTKPCDEVIILQYAEDNSSCDTFGNIYFLCTEKSGAASFLPDSLVNCGMAPTIDTSENRLVFDPIGMLNESSSYIPSLVYKYTNGTITRTDSTPPIIISFRQSAMSTSYVAQIRNYSDTDTLNLWFVSLHKKSSFVLPPNTYKEFGWLEGFSIGANNSVSIGGDGFSAVSCYPPSKELSDFKLTLTDAGFGISISQEYIQREAINRYVKPIKRKYLSFVTAEMKNPPILVLNENSNRIIAKTNVFVSVLVDGLGIGVDIVASGIPQYNPSNRGLYLKDVRIDSIGLDLVKKEYREYVRLVANIVLAEYFQNYMITKIPNFPGIGIVRNIAVNRGRLSVFIL